MPQWEACCECLKKQKESQLAEAGWASTQGVGSKVKGNEGGTVEGLTGHCNDFGFTELRNLKDPDILGELHDHMTLDVLREVVWIQ